MSIDELENELEIEEVSDDDDDEMTIPEIPTYSQDEIKAKIVDSKKGIKVQFKPWDGSLLLHIQVNCAPLNRPYGYAEYYPVTEDIYNLFNEIFTKGKNSGACVPSMTGSGKPYGIARIHKTATEGEIVISCNKTYALVKDIELWNNFETIAETIEAAKVQVQVSDEVN